MTSEGWIELIAYLIGFAILPVALLLAIATGRFNDQR